ncbi:hypothetical protein P20495_1616 [Pseudoalteromonas sp. BSi20495]|nr:hypothetical protein P20495_1616 [Pseudoalteromonas sp. BSi20495]
MPNMRYLRVIDSLLLGFYLFLQWCKPLEYAGAGAEPTRLQTSRHD